MYFSNILRYAYFICSLINVQTVLAIILKYFKQREYCKVTLTLKLLIILILSEVVCCSRKLTLKDRHLVKTRAQDGRKKPKWSITSCCGKGWENNDRSFSRYTSSESIKIEKRLRFLNMCSFFSSTSRCLMLTMPK